VSLLSTTKVCTLQSIYGAKRRLTSYQSLMQPAEGQGPMVMATWDDHDFCLNNYGDNCDSAYRTQSQETFLKHFGVPETDLRWQQHGVYGSNMFGTAEEENRVHVIMLDVRSSRSPTYSSYGACQEDTSRALDETQWEWLVGGLVLI
jgi:alkaline phosphatase D